MTTQELFGKIIIDLLKDSYLGEFKFVKTYSMLYTQQGDLRKSIELEHWSDFEELFIRPIYGVKFGILNEWFKSYNTLSKFDQKANSDVFFGEIEGLTSVSWNEYSFRKDGGDYQAAFEVLRSDIVNCSKFVFDNYDTLQKIYEKEVEPILNGIRKLGLKDLGANWIFRYLRLCRIVNPDAYPQLKDILISHFEFMKSRKEPNVMKYVPRLDEILNHLERIPCG